jgi:hypothetical protein
MPKILQNSQHPEDLLLCMPVNGILFRARIPKAGARKAFDAQETFGALAGVIRENLARMEKIIWQKYTVHGQTDMELSEADLLMAGPQRI